MESTCLKNEFEMKYIAVINFNRNFQLSRIFVPPFNTETVSYQGLAKSVQFEGCKDYENISIFHLFSKESDNRNKAFFRTKDLEYLLC